MVASHSQQQLNLTSEEQRFAWVHYLCKPVTLRTFRYDFSRFRFLNLALSRDDIDPKVCINHLVILFNTFEASACLHLMFSTINEENHSKLKTILLFVNMLPPIIPHSGINTLNIPLDVDLHSMLGSMK